MRMWHDGRSVNASTRVETSSGAAAAPSPHQWPDITLAAGSSNLILPTAAAVVHDCMTA